jgi:hypothetical protein
MLKLLVVSALALVLALVRMALVLITTNAATG